MIKFIIQVVVGAAITLIIVAISGLVILSQTHPHLF